MNDKDMLHSSTKKILITVLTQGIVLILSIITGFILPQKMGPVSYGYWQIYIFYFSFLNLFGLGFNDGIALFYGGYDFENLPFKKIRSAMRFIYIYLIVITALLFFAASFARGAIYRQIYELLALSVPLTCLLCIIMTVFLAVNKTGIYNIITLVTKLLAVLFYIILLLFGFTDAPHMMNADFLSRVIITIICLILGRKFLFGKADNFREGIGEFKEKSMSGINITLAILASTFIPITGRMVVEWNESIKTYGIFSFAMSLLGFIMMFTTTSGTVLFPILKKLNSEELPNYYVKFAFICDSLIYIALFAYIPLLLIVQHIMTKYVSSLDYLYILLVMCLPLGRMQLLITPYYKAFRMEKAFLITNILGLISMFGLTYLSYYIFKSLISVAICTTLVITIWTYLTERYLNKKINNKMDIKSIIIQICMITLFIVAGYFKNPLIFAIIYSSSIIFYFLIYKEKTKNALKLLKS